MMSTFKTANPRQAVVDKENIHPTLCPAPPASSLNVEEYYPNHSGKRALLEAAPITESRPCKKAKIDEPSLPDHSFSHPIHDDGTKPGHSYAQLIGMAIMRAPQRKLTLSQIYKWISDTYKFYSATDAGWQNSIRHNLSLNKAFIKQERPKDDPGKGNYWAIEPGMEQQFMKEKPSRKATAVSENMHIMSMTPRVDYSHFETSYHQDGLPPLPSVPPSQPRSEAPSSLQDVSQAPAIPAPEPSSDATILLSDNAGLEDLGDNVQELNAFFPTSLASPLPPAMHSSPPMPRFLDQRSNTPPPAPVMLQTSRKRVQKRKHVSMDASASVDDSGYISSLESSAVRHQNNLLFSSGTRPPRVKGGRRAEDEIRRIRHSSYDSPTKSRSHGPMPPSSSPLRNSHHGQMPPPLTPVVKMRAPPKPTASASPNTNLQAHRDHVTRMMESPLRRQSTISETIANMTPWGSTTESPSAYGMGFSTSYMDPNDFSFFLDGRTLDFGLPSDLSPTKKSVRKPRALGDITSSVNRKSVTSAPFLEAPSPSTAFGYESPSKAFGDMRSPCKTFSQLPMAAAEPGLQVAIKESDWANLENSYTSLFGEETENFLDIAQGFEKIGGGNHVIGSWKCPKLGLGQNYSTQ
jgi:hypothetical protein